MSYETDPPWEGISRWLKKGSGRFETLGMNGKSSTVSNPAPFVLSYVEGLREDFSAAR
jgi:hypothetical protein